VPPAAVVYHDVLRLQQQQLGKGEEAGSGGGRCDGRVPPLFQSAAELQASYAAPRRSQPAGCGRDSLRSAWDSEPPMRRWWLGAREEEEAEPEPPLCWDSFEDWALPAVPTHKVGCSSGS